MALRLEVFAEPATAGGATVVTDLTAIDQGRLASYEEGYRAGWDDGSAAQAEDQARLSAELARNLQALSFTYHEARQHVLAALRPFLTEAVARVLPLAARAALAPMIAEALLPLAEEAADAPVEVRINPAARTAVEAAVPESGSLPRRLVEDPELGEGQALLRLGGAEARIDLDAAVQRIAAALADFFTLTETEPHHG